MSLHRDPTAPLGGEPARRRVRERVHFTAGSGWINDPHGICWAGGQYHLFFQYNPVDTSWSSKVVWGHAVSPDLVRWRYTGIALAPRLGEEGCWSGATIVENDRPTIFYTSVLPGNWGRGRVALAHPDDDAEHWSSLESDVLIDGPPAQLSARAFRDPCIIRRADGWTMIVGAGVDGGIGMAVQFHSVDARHWSDGGVICSRSGTQTDGVWTGTVWECPQLLAVGDDWLLIVSIWDAETVHYVAAAVGTYDGSTFTPENWSRLTHDSSAYAMTSFTDNQGRPCVMSWLREPPEHDPLSALWAGSLSLPMVVGISSDRTVVLQPHPDVATLRQSRCAYDGPLRRQSIHLPDATTGTDIILVIESGLVEFDLTNQSDAVAAIRVDSHSDLIVVERSGQATVAVPRASAHVRIIIDTDLIEIYAGDGSASLRMPCGTDADLAITGTATTVAVYRLSTAFDETT